MTPCNSIDDPCEICWYIQRQTWCLEEANMQSVRDSLIMLDLEVSFSSAAHMFQKSSHLCDQVSLSYAGLHTFHSEGLLFAMMMLGMLRSHHTTIVMLYL